jgi:hypothetical protein
MDLDIYNKEVKRGASRRHILLSSDQGIEYVYYHHIDYYKFMFIFDKI